MRRHREEVRIEDARCPECGVPFGPNYTDDGNFVECPSCGEETSIDRALALRCRELDDLYEDAQHRRAEAAREEAYERRRSGS